jgi:hypothetical protein
MRGQQNIKHKSKVVKLIDYINYENFANMKGTVYGNRLLRGMQVKKSFGTAAVDKGNIAL